MSDELILSFPVLKQDSGDFLDSVTYTANAVQLQNNRKLIITHTLKGESFIAELLKSNKAKFSVSLFYKDNAERQNFVSDDYDYDEEAQEISAEQEINIDYSYAPEITPCVAITSNESVVVNDKSGLTSFWQGESFDIPAYSRLAYYLKLKFSSGNVSSLLHVSCEENYPRGAIKTTVMPTAGEGEQPIQIICAQDVYDELKKGTPDPIDANTAMRSSIVTQVLCYVYACMNSLEDKETDIHSGLLQHMKELKEKTGEDWEGDDFNASFASTKTLPYAINALNKGV
jgi:hypothetical protein